MPGGDDAGRDGGSRSRLEVLEASVFALEAGLDALRRELMTKAKVGSLAHVVSGPSVRCRTIGCNTSRDALFITHHQAGAEPAGKPRRGFGALGND